MEQNSLCFAGQQSIMVVGGISTSNTIFQNCFLLHYESSKVQIEKVLSCRMLVVVVW